MNRYPVVRAGEILQLVREPTVTEPDELYVAIGIKSFGKGILRYPPTPGAELSKMRYFRFPADALAISNIKAWEGAISVTSEGDTQAIASNRFLFYLPRDPEAVDIRFVWNYLLSDQGLREMAKASPGSADRNRTMSISGFERIQLPLPPLTDQRRIVKLLTQTRNASRFGDGNYDPIETALRASVLRWAFPQNQPTIRVADLVTLAREPISIHLNTQYEPIGVRSFGKGMIYYSACPGAELSKLRYFRFPEGALVLSNIKAWEGAVAVTASGDSARIASNRFLFYIPNSEDRIDVRFLRYYLISDDGLAQLGKASPGSADRNRTLSIEGFSRIRVPVPGLDVQRRTVEYLDLAFERLTTASARRRVLRSALRTSMVNAAFTGQL